MYTLRCYNWSVFIEVFLIFLVDGFSSLQYHLAYIELKNVKHFEGYHAVALEISKLCYLVWEMLLFFLYIFNKG